ncbi:hypothetical protein [Bacillus alkalicellulosilyticus]|uniref:hypothetical protein n=1 Tax=Alkalihalobacterium alkalicellulosilyticum TaxID=1912214 RepID=UPI0009979766|nr:hypothetical protein [Bacillus alkalicellulosilyticus]
MLTQQEQAIVHQYVLLSIAKQALEVDLHTLQKASLKFQEPYLDITYNVLTTIQRDLAVLKRNMHKLQLSVRKNKNDGMFSYFDSYCRGYHETHQYLNIHLKKEVFQYMSKYFKQSKQA